MWQLRRAGIRQAVFFHEVQIRYSLPGLYNKLRALQQQLIANLCARLAGGRVATSIPLYQTYFWGNRPQLIPISPNLQPLPGIVPVPYRVVAFANRLYPFLLEALAAVQQQLPALQVLWLGKKALDAPDAEAIAQTYGLQSSFTGALPTEALAAQLQMATLVLLPLQTDNRGRGGISLKSGTLSAALAMGKPVIASRGDMTDTALLRHGCVLHLPEQNTAAAWKESITLLLHDTAYANRLGKGGLLFFQQHLTWLHTTRAVQKLFDHGG
jgi:glycosyltransferase involved in cell wall biosynthesis